MLMMAEDGLPTLEYGRYRLWKTPDGGWLLGRAAFTCDRCQSCGCGEQQDHVTVPGMMVRLAESMQRGEGPPIPGMGFLGRLMGRGRGSGTEGGSGSETAAESDDHAGRDLPALPAGGSADQEGDSPAAAGSPAASDPV